MAIMIKTPQEIEKMRISGKALREVHNAIAPHVVPGASTMDLEEIAVKKIAELGAIAAFKGYHGYPAALCTSVNDEVVHGIPSAKRILNEGDILSIDCGVIIDGYYSDAAVTYPIGKVAPKTAKLLEVTQASLEKAIQQCLVGGRLGDISAAVQELCEAEGFGVVREFVGHGIGRAMHEDPQVPNFGDPGKGPRLKAGMVLAIEPMINAGGPEVRVLKDGWTAITIDGSYSAHFEHTVAITKDGPQVLTR
ncbi:MAG TPA: type I methionyl aminopeptidase [Edaphobacter sp.]|jgi:methionyl aminopeptidase|nr:type I methionyl aminopeptidase [Edaphobacter sp.]